MKDKDLRFKRKYFEMIASGRKKLEARVNYPSVRGIKVGDTVRFFWEDRSVNVRITAVRVYNGFKDMLDKENPALLVPGMSREQALSEYQNIYPSWKVKKFGGVRVFAFDII